MSIATDMIANSIAEEVRAMMARRQTKGKALAFWWMDHALAAIDALRGES